MKFHSLLLAVVLLCAFLLPGCGGGSKGTGGDQLTGRVVNVQQDPIVGVSVTELSSGENAVTGPDGGFSIRTDLPAGTVAIGVDTGSVSSTVSITGVTESTIELRVIIQLDERSGATKVVEVGRTESTHTPGPNSQPTERPTRTATPNGAVKITPTPVSAATPTVPAVPNGATPTPHPIATSDDDDDGDDDEDVEVEGAVSAVNASFITVDGVTYRVTAETRVEGDDVQSIGDISTGDIVRVRVERSNGELVALQIELQSGDDD